MSVCVFGRPGPLRQRPLSDNPTSVCVCVGVLLVRYLRFSVAYENVVLDVIAVLVVQAVADDQPADGRVRFHRWGALGALNWWRNAVGQCLDAANKKTKKLGEVGKHNNNRCLLGLQLVIGTVYAGKLNGGCTHICAIGEHVGRRVGWADRYVLTQSSTDDGGGDGAHVRAVCSREATFLYYE